MTKLIRLLLVVVIMSLFAASTMAKKPEKPGEKPDQTDVTEYCKITGDIQGEGFIGVKAWTYAPMTLTISARLLGDLMPEGSFSGVARVMKNQGGTARLDFHFNDDGTDCRPIELGEWPPPLPPEVCRQYVGLLDGVYNGKTKDVEFINARAVAHNSDLYDPDTEDWLYETTTNTKVDFKPFSE